MLDHALEVIEILEQRGFCAYIVGGYVRDFLLNRDTTDIDICTNALVKDIVNIFDNIYLSSIQYGSVSIIYKNEKFDITTFRKEIKYDDNRRPVKIKYINNLKRDLIRRDFTINTLCMDKNGNVLDLLNVKDDLANGVIRTVGNPRYRIKEDSLRILRAIRFSVSLNFSIDDRTMFYLKKYGYLLKKLSYDRKKMELNKIFSSSFNDMGKKLLIDLDLCKYLEIDKLKDAVMCQDIIGIWSQLDVDFIYPFSKLEKEQMQAIRDIVNVRDIDSYMVYRYGLYLCTVAAQIMNIDIVYVNELYNDLPIKCRKDIVVKPTLIANTLNKSPGSYLKDIISDVEEKIVNGEVNNVKEDIIDYVIREYK